MKWSYQRHWVISHIFNVVDIYEYHGRQSDDNHNKVCLEVWLPHQPLEQIKKILDSRIRRNTKNKQYQDYLVKWKGRPTKDSTHISQAKVDCLGFPLAPKK